MRYRSTESFVTSRAPRSNVIPRVSTCMLGSTWSESIVRFVRLTNRNVPLISAARSDGYNSTFEPRAPRSFELSLAVEF